MSTLTIAEVQSQLSKLLEQLRPGEEVIITKHDRTIARLTAELPVGVPIPGRCKGMLTIISDDDEHLQDFAEYMP